MQQAALLEPVAELTEPAAELFMQHALPPVQRSALVKPDTMLTHIGARIAKRLLQRRNARLQRDDIAFKGRLIVGHPIVQYHDILL
jgi:hypothetical protein